MRKNITKGKTWRQKTAIAGCLIVGLISYFPGILATWAAQEVILQNNNSIQMCAVSHRNIKGEWDSNRGPGVTRGYGTPSGYNSSAFGPGVSAVVTQGQGVITYGTNNNTVGSPTYGGNHWCQDGYGWWYQYANGTYPINCWQQIDGRYYCFNQDGYRRYGWINWNQKWYYCGEDGALMGNTRTPDGYYVGPDGVWIPGR